MYLYEALRILDAHLLQPLPKKICIRTLDPFVDAFEMRVCSRASRPSSTMELRHATDSFT
jgi:hypothetical protein